MKISSIIRKRMLHILSCDSMASVELREISKKRHNVASITPEEIIRGKSRNCHSQM